MVHRRLHVRWVPVLCLAALLLGGIFHEWALAITPARSTAAPDDADLAKRSGCSPAKGMHSEAVGSAVERWPLLPAARQFTGTALVAASPLLAVRAARPDVRPPRYALSVLRI